MNDWPTAPIFGFDPDRADAIVRPSAYALVENAAGCIAIVRASRGVFLPGGGIEETESPEAAVVRECQEEVGLTVRVGAWRRSAIEYVYDQRAGYEKRSTFLDAIVTGSPAAPLESDHELVWIEIARAARVLTPESHRWAVLEWRARARAEMSIPSTDSLRGQRDGIGFAREAADMAAVVCAAGLPPHPHRFPECNEGRNSRPGSDVHSGLTPHSSFTPLSRLAPHSTFAPLSSLAPHSTFAPLSSLAPHSTFAPLSNLARDPGVAARSSIVPPVGAICPHDDYLYAGRVYRDQDLASRDQYGP